MGEGKLERNAVLKAVCAGFKETTEPPICLSGGFYRDYELKMMTIISAYGNMEIDGI